LIHLPKRRYAIFTRVGARTCEDRANPKFWQFYTALPENIQRLADENYQLLKRDPHHPSLHFKKVGRYWSARVGIHYRAVAVEDGSDIVWFWIGHLDSVGLNSLPEHWAAPCFLGSTVL
jgi:hypothetical protein